MQETQIQSLGQKDPLEKEMASQSSILAWEIPCTEELGGLQSMELQRVGHNWTTNTFTFFFHQYVGSRRQEFFLDQDIILACKMVTFPG